MRRWLVVAMLTSVVGCGTPPPTRFDAGPTVRIANNATTAVFEGQGRVVTVLTAEGADFTGASVVAEDGSLSVVESLCVGAQCAVVVRVLDTVPDVGRSVPSPIDATNRYLRVVQSGRDDYRALFSVAPLDAIANEGDAASVRGTYFAASVSTVPDTVFRGALGMEPVRWFVFGDAVLRGTIDVSAEGTRPGPGGYAGAMVGSATMEPASGTSGTATDGAGGGGSFEPGESGEGAAGLSGGAAFGPGCGWDPFVDDCGGGGGGSADGIGGGGGGTFALIALGTLDVDADIDASGAEGVDGGGGGGGGRVIATGSTVVGAGARVNVDGGVGGARAGAAGGGGGRGETWAGPTVDTPTGWIVRDPSWTIAGHATPTSRVEIETIDGRALGSSVAAADGSFSVSVMLTSGLNRLRVTEVMGAGRRRAWSGNHFEFERQGPDLFPIGGLLDVAYLP